MGGVECLHSSVAIILRKINQSTNCFYTKKGSLSLVVLRAKNAMQTNGLSTEVLCNYSQDINTCISNTEFPKTIVPTVQFI